MTDLEAKARELLAQEYGRDGWKAKARELREEDYEPSSDELRTLRALTPLLDRIRVLEEALERVLTWWPEGSENGRLDKGDSFAINLQAARQALSHREDGGRV